MLSVALMFTICIKYTQEIKKKKAHLSKDLTMNTYNIRLFDLLDTSLSNIFISQFIDN